MTQFILVSQLFRFTFNTLMLYSHTSISNYNFPDIFQDTQPSYVLVKSHFFPLKLFIITQTKSELPLLTLTAFKNLLIACLSLTGFFFFGFCFLYIWNYKWLEGRYCILSFSPSQPVSNCLSLNGKSMNRWWMSERMNGWLFIC